MPFHSSHGLPWHEESEQFRNSQSCSEIEPRHRIVPHRVSDYYVRTACETYTNYQTSMDIDDVFEAQKRIVSVASGFEPRFRAHGGSNDENLVLQNIQARSRMVTVRFQASHIEYY
jgi:NH3-dependent NAD+ synthetase